MFSYKQGGQEQGGSSAGKNLLPSPSPSPLPSALGARHPAAIAEYSYECINPARIHSEEWERLVIPHDTFHQPAFLRASPDPWGGIRSDLCSSPHLSWPRSTSLQDVTAGRTGRDTQAGSSTSATPLLLSRPQAQPGTGVSISRELPDFPSSPALRRRFSASQEQAAGPGPARVLLKLMLPTKNHCR